MRAKQHRKPGLKGKSFHRPGWLFRAMILIGMIAGSGAFGVTNTVRMSNFQFVPKDITINAGDTVTWVNQDFTAHDTTSGTNGVPSGLWHSPLFGNGGSFSFKFNVPAGYYGYYCTPHVFTFHMVGSVTVVAANTPPSVAITNPIDGASFLAGANVLVQASASDSDGTVARVDFAVNGTAAGSAQAQPYTLTLNNVAAGNYAIQAVAVDNQGASSAPSVVNITVIQGNLPPSVTITNPANGQAFFAGTNVTVQADASDADGSVRQVEFFINDVSAGIKTTPPYFIEITNIAQGSYNFRAVATDDQNASSTSATVVISVGLAPIPPTLISGPVGTTNQVGGSATFSVSAGGTAPLAFQWLFNLSPIAGATNSSLSLTNLQIADSGSYAVKVTNVAGAVISPPAILLVYAPATLSISSPENGSEFQFPAAVTSTAVSSDNALIAQVRFSLAQPGLGTNLVGISTNSPFSILLTNLSPGTYFLGAQATDIHGASIDAAPAQFFVRASPILTRTPADETLPPGTSVELLASVDTNGPAVTSVRFLVNGSLLGDVAETPFSLLFQTNLFGDYSFVAVAFDSAGQAFTSAPVALRISVPEIVRPVIVITSSPPNFSRTNAASVMLAGTAVDNVGIDHVEYQVNGGSNHLASGTAAWQLTAQLVPGANTVRVRSVDLRTNASFDAVRYFTYVVSAPLAVQVDPDGSGTVTPDLTRAPLELGKAYTLTARPHSGFIFDRWEGIAGKSDPTLVFEMNASFTNLVAHFIPNPFPGLAGNYSGVFLDADTNNLSVETSGFLSLKLGNAGAFSGKVAMQGKNYAFSGQFHDPTNAVVPVIRHGLKPIVLSMTLDPSGMISGFVTNSTGTNNAFSSSTFVAEKNPFNWNSHTAPQVGSHAFVLNQNGENAFARGKAQIRADGLVQYSGTLSGSKKLSFSSTLAESGNSPFYFSFNKGSEAVVGVFNFGVASGQPLSGELYWLGTNSVPLDAIPAP